EVKVGAGRGGAGYMSSRLSVRRAGFGLGGFSRGGRHGRHPFARPCRRIVSVGPCIVTPEKCAGARSWRHRVIQAPFGDAKMTQLAGRVLPLRGERELDEGREHKERPEDKDQGYGRRNI